MPTRPLKFKFSRVMTPFQLCRSRKASSSVQAPTKMKGLSPFNPKKQDIYYPNLLPGPPPPTPDSPSSRGHVSRKLRSSLAEKPQVPLKNYIRTLSFSDDSIDDSSSLFSTEQKIQNFRDQRSFNLAGGDYSTGCFSSEDVVDGENQETETLLFSSTSLSYDSSSDFSHSLECLAETQGFETKKSKSNDDNKVMASVRKVEETVSYSAIPSPVRASVLRKMISCTADGKVKESVAVVKRSEDPYEDFKRSMLEMILEKQIFEDSDLEELLRCFLSLNSRQYHGIIVEAFSEIWEVLFTDSPVKKLAAVKNFSRN